MGTSPNQSKTNPNNSSSQYSAYIASPETINDPNWYMDSGASHHIINNHSNLQQAEKCSGKANLIVGNGQKLHISHIGNSTIHHPFKSIYLENIIYYTEIKKILLSISALTSQNNVVVEFDSENFIVKVKRTRRIILQGSIKDGLHKLSVSNPTSNSVSNHYAQQPSTSKNQSKTSFHAFLIEN